MRFQEVVGQQLMINQLRRIVDDDKLPHALFLEGKSGYGPLALALAISAYILTPKAERSDLENSKSYQKAIKYIHPDLNFTFPVVLKEGKKRESTTSTDYLPEWRSILQSNPYFSFTDWLISISNSNSAGNINVAECNQILNNLSLKPFESDYKVQIIWMPQYLGNNGNRLLKMIEEPPQNSVIIFVGDSTEGVLNTITSRCQIIRVPRIDDEPLEAQLMSRHNINAEEAQRLSILADGDFASASAVLTMDSTISLSFMLEWLEACASGDAILIKEWIEKFRDLSKEEKKGTLIYFIKILRETIHIKLLGNRLNKLDPSQSKLVENNVILNKLTIEHISNISDVVNNVYALLERNANPKILLFYSSLQIGQIITKSTL